MDDPGGVRGLDAATGLRDQVGGAVNRQAALAVEQVGEALADEVLHDDEGRAVVGDAEIDGGRHVVVLQRPRRLGLALEPAQDVAALGEVAAQELDREAPTDDGVVRLVDDAHPAPREQANDPVLPPTISPMRVASAATFIATSPNRRGSCPDPLALPSSGRPAGG